MFFWYNFISNLKLICFFKINLVKGYLELASTGRCFLIKYPVTAFSLISYLSDIMSRIYKDTL